MKAYLKKDPSRVGYIHTVYVTDFGQKRFTIYFLGPEGYELGVVDAAAEEFEVVPEEGEYHDF